MPRDVVGRCCQINIDLHADRVGRRDRSVCANPFRLKRPVADFEIVVERAGAAVENRQITNAHTRVLEYHYGASNHSSLNYCHMSHQEQKLLCRPAIDPAAKENNRRPPSTAKREERAEIGVGRHYDADFSNCQLEYC